MKENDSFNVKFFVIAIFCLILMSQTAQAATLNVPSAQYPTIQSAVNAANSGDTIVLQAGVTFTEQVILKYKPGNDYITIQSSALSNLPPTGQRVNPSHAQYMPKIVPPNSLGAILTEITANGPSHHYRLLGIEISQANPPQYIDTLVTLGSGDSDQNTLAKVAHHFIIDRCYIHGQSNGSVKRGIGLNSHYTDIVNSYIEEIHAVDGKGDAIDSQAIAGWNGPGQYLIENNYLEAASENILFGGGDPNIANLVPSDIIIRRNLVTKKLAWYGLNPDWGVKNIFELKNARRINIEQNIFEKNWAEAQSGFAILFTVRNQGGNAPWSVIEDVNFSYNIVRNTPSAITFLARDNKNPSQNVKNVNISYNLLSSVSSLPTNPDASNGKCIQLVGGGPLGTENLTLNHNTCIGLGNYPAFIYGDSDNSIKVTGFNIKNNIAMSRNSGNDASIDGNQLAGEPALNAMTNFTWTMQKNILMLPSGSMNYPNSNLNINSYVTDYSTVGFVNYANGDYALSSTSPYRNQSTDGTDPGANIQLLDQIKPCIESGNWTTCASSSQTPYPPTTPSILNTIEVENFDNGGNFANGGFAYNDTFGNTGSVAYRSNPVEAVDILANSNASNGYTVFEAAAGEWLEYTVNVPATGFYNFKVRYASGYTQPNSQGQFRLEVCEPAPNNGVTNCIPTSNITVNSTNGWNSFNTVSRTLNLTSSGTRILRLIMVTNAPGDGTPQCNCVVANFDSIAISKGVLFDYDNDRKADISVFRPSDVTWYLQQSTNGYSAVVFGLSNDIIAPADFDGDGKTDIAIFRPSTGTWWIRRTTDPNNFLSVQFGTSGDIPVQADYDADGKADIAVWRPSDGVWYISKSTGGTTIQAFGQNGDRPAIGDYDGDGKYDLAVFRPSSPNGQWHILRSSNGSYSVTSYGGSTDKITPADYDGDGKTDIAVWRPSEGNWYILNSANGQSATTNFGLNGDIPVPADYDADGRADIAVYRPTGGVWHLLRTTDGYTSLAFGLSTDIPTPSTYIR